MDNYKIIYDALTNEDNLEDIEISLANNLKTKLEQLAILPVGDRYYGLVKPIEPKIFGLEEDGFLVFMLDEEKETASLCMNEKIIEKVFLTYKNENEGA